MLVHLGKANLWESVQVYLSANWACYKEHNSMLSLFNAFSNAV